MDKKSFYKEKGVKDKSEEKKRGKEWGKELIFKESRLSLQLTLNSSHTCILFGKKQNKKILSWFQKNTRLFILKKNYCTEEKIYT